MARRGENIPRPRRTPAAGTYIVTIDASVQRIAGTKRQRGHRLLGPADARRSEREIVAITVIQA